MRNSHPNRIPEYLTGWKEIAHYLGYSIRTLQRYERAFALPIRRPYGKSRASVLATKAELDAWMDADPFRDGFRSQGTPALARSRALATDVINSLAEMKKLRDALYATRTELVTAIDEMRKTQCRGGELILERRLDPSKETKLTLGIGKTASAKKDRQNLRSPKFKPLWSARPEKSPHRQNKNAARAAERLEVTCDAAATAES
jgi:hypothetical protein